MNMDESQPGVYSGLRPTNDRLGLGMGWRKRAGQGNHKRSRLWSLEARLESTQKARTHVELDGIKWNLTQQYSVKLELCSCKLT